MDRSTLCIVIPKFTVTILNRSSLHSNYLVAQVSPIFQFNSDPATLLN